MAQSLRFGLLHGQNQLNAFGQAAGLAGQNAFMQGAGQGGGFTAMRQLQQGAYNIAIAYCTPSELSLAGTESGLWKGDMQIRKYTYIFIRPHEHSLMNHLDTKLN